MGVALSLGALLLGWGADRLRRRGVAREAVLAVIAIVFIVAQLALAVRAPIPTYISWGLIAAVGAATVLSFAILPEYFPKEMSARANAALNILHLIGAFFLQYMTGVIVSLWPPEAGHPPAQAYQAAVGFGVILQAAALLWFLATARAAQAPVFRALRPVMSVSATPQHRVVPIDYATAQLALAHHVASARSHAAHWRRIGIASAALCLCLAITFATTGHSHVFAYVVEAPASNAAANLDNDEAAQPHSAAALNEADSMARMPLAELAHWPSIDITAARRADLQRSLYTQGP
jgi:MFS family permease